MLGSEIGQAPGHRREDAEIATFGKCGAIGQDELYLLLERRLWNDSPDLGERVRG